MCQLRCQVHEEAQAHKVRFNQVNKNPDRVVSENGFRRSSHVATRTNDILTHIACLSLSISCPSLILQRRWRSTGSL